MLKNYTKIELSNQQVTQIMLDIMAIDTRVATLFCTHLVPEVLKGYHMQGAGLVDSYGSKVAVRAFTDQGCDLTPSCMKGAGRKFDQDEFDRYYTEDVETVILVNVSNFPSVEFVEVLGCTIVESNLKKLSSNCKVDLFSNSAQVNLS